MVNVRKAVMSEKDGFVFDDIVIDTIHSVGMDDLAGDVYMAYLVSCKEGSVVMIRTPGMCNSYRKCLFPSNADKVAEAKSTNKTPPAEIPAPFMKGLTDQGGSDSDKLSRLVAATEYNRFANSKNVKDKEASYEYIGLHFPKGICLSNKFHSPKSDEFSGVIKTTAVTFVHDWLPPYATKPEDTIPLANCMLHWKLTIHQDPYARKMETVTSSDNEGLAALMKSLGM